MARKEASEREKRRSRERTREWLLAHPGATFARNLRKYKLTPEEFYAMVEAQQGVCRICLQPPTGGKNSSARLNVDHDHQTGLVRGLLCTNCNTAIGLMKDSPDRLRAAAMYLMKSE